MEPTDSDLWVVFASELRRVAGELGCDVEDVKRAAFIDKSTFGKRYAKRGWGGWSACRAMVAEGRSPLDPSPQPSSPPPVDVSGLDFDDVPDTDRIQPSDYASDGHPFPIVPPGTRLKAASTYVNGQWVKTEPIPKAEQLARLLAELPERIPQRGECIPPPPSTLSDLLAVYPVGDPHLGMYAWGEEAQQDWDLDKSLAVHRAAIDHLVSTGPRAERALFVPLGDILHADNADNRTSRGGHALDVDTRYAKIVRAARDLLVYCIDRLLEHHAHVTVDALAGNHDDHSALTLSVGLDSHYHNEPRVDVSLSPALHRYHRHGKCLVGLTHGHTTRSMDKLAGVMACDRPEDWGETEHRMWIVGHLHHTKRIELAGCVAEIFRTLAPRDAWAQGAGFRGGRDMHRIVLHRDHGEVSRTMVGASYLEALGAVA